MASVHTAYIGLLPVDATGAVVNKATCTIHERVGASEEPRVLYDATYAPNAANNPRIEAYLAAEVAAGFTIVHVSNTMIVTHHT